MPEDKRMRAGDKKFKVITNNDIYAELQDHRKLLEANATTIKVHDEQIQNMQKLLYATTGSLVTFAISVVVYFVTRGAAP